MRKILVAFVHSLIVSPFYASFWKRKFLIHFWNFSEWICIILINVNVEFPLHLVQSAFDCLKFDCDDTSGFVYTLIASIKRDNQERIIIATVNLLSRFLNWLKLFIFCFLLPIQFSSWYKFRSREKRRRHKRQKTLLKHNIIELRRKQWKCMLCVNCLLIFCFYQNLLIRKTIFYIHRRFQLVDRPSSLI